MALSKSKIDYLTHVWNFYTGCKNQETGVCKLPCWARAQAKRFGRSFGPRLNEKMLYAASMPRDPARIGVCFTGDLFGNWVDPYAKVHLRDAAGTIFWTDPLAYRVLATIRENPKHQFLFLTKCPTNIKKWQETFVFPDNAWVGITATNWIDFTSNVGILALANAIHKWLSFEPLLAWPDVNISLLKSMLLDAGISWVVIGACTGEKKEMEALIEKHPKLTLRPYRRKWKAQPKTKWVKGIIEACDQAGIPVFLKNNLGWLKTTCEGAAPFYRYHESGTWILRQELPK